MIFLLKREILQTYIVCFQFKLYLAAMSHNFKSMYIAKISLTNHSIFNLNCQ